jgi:hypothetical protein
MSPSRAACRPILLAATVFVASCATTKMDAQWSNPEFAGTSLRGATVLVVCQARDFTTQAVCEDQAASQLEAKGIKTLKFAAMSPNAPPVPDVVEAAAKRANARVVYRSSISTYTPAVSSTPTIGIGVGGVGGSGGYGGVGYGDRRRGNRKADVVGPLNQPGRLRHHFAACRLDARHVRGAFGHWADLACYLL